VKNDLEKVRDWAEARIKSGHVPDWSWPQHVKLIEALDAVLHDMSVAGNPSRSRRYRGRILHLLERKGSLNATAHSPMKRKASRPH
jgi:hypothetical protein